MAYDLNTGLQYGATGAATGAAIGAGAGGIGALPGAAIGFGAGMLTGFAGGGKKSPWYDEGFFADRERQINTFSENLARARARYATSLGNMYNLAFRRFSGNAEAGFASRGLQVSGGAFASTLARQVADYQAQLEPTVFAAEREDLGAVESQRGNLFTNKLAAKMGAGNLAYQASRENAQALGAFGASMFNRYLDKRSGAPTSPRYSGASDWSSGSPFNSYSTSNPGRVPMGKLDTLPYWQR